MDFGTKVLAGCKELSEKGSLSENEDIEKHAQALSGAGNGLLSWTCTQGAGMHVSPSAKRLLETARDSSKTANDLVERMRDLKIGDRRRKREIVIKLARSLRERKDIKNLQKKLDDYRKTLDTQILVDLRCVKTCDGIQG